MTDVLVEVSAPGRPRPVTPLGIVSARLAEVLELLDDTVAGADLDPRIRDGVALAHELAAGLDPYLEANAGAESTALQALAERTAAHDWTTHARAADRSRSAAPLEQEMVSGFVEGRLLAFLVRLTRARRVLEIGMFTGYSALALAEALPDGGTVLACEIDPTAAAMAVDSFATSPAGERIEVRLGPALDTLTELAGAGETFDLVFLDADKAGYPDYLHTLLDPRSARPGRPGLRRQHPDAGAAVDPGAPQRQRASRHRVQPGRRRRPAPAPGDPAAP